MISSHDDVERADYVALAEFRKGLRKFIHFAEQSAREVGITPQQHQVLLAVMAHADRDWVSVRELAEALQVSHHAMVGLVDRCQTAGLVARCADAQDRRIVHVTLTEKGRDVLRQVTAKNLRELRYLEPLARAFRALGE